MVRLNKRLVRVKIEDIMYLIFYLNGFGISAVDNDLLEQRLHNLGFVYRREGKKYNGNKLAKIAMSWR